MVVGIPIIPWTVVIMKVAKTHLLASAINQAELPKYADINFFPQT